MGMVKDVLIKEREFMFPHGFVNLENIIVVFFENDILTTLNGPFSTTSNALIYCMDEKMNDLRKYDHVASIMSSTCKINHCDLVM